MTELSRRIIPLAATVALAASCSEKSTGTDIALEDAPAEIAKTVCPRAYGCCSAMQLMGNEFAGADEPSCEVKTTEGFRKNLDGARNAIRKKRLIYRGDRLAACLAFIRSAPCERLNRTNHFSGLECEPYLEPQQGLGEPCDGDGECSDGSCVKPAGGGGDSVCRPSPVQGESCAEHRCAKGFACTGANKTCAVSLPEGAVCTAPTQCASGNCGGFFGGSGTCAPPPPTSCFYSSACAYGGGRRPPGPGGILPAVCCAALALKLRRRRR